MEVAGGKDESSNLNHSSSGQKIERALAIKVEDVRPWGVGSKFSAAYADATLSDRLHQALGPGWQGLCLAAATGCPPDNVRIFKVQCWPRKGGDSEMELPCPLFEGSEKRIEVEFAFGAKAPIDGLRCLTREQLDSLMSQAACCIVSHRANEDFDAYVLSESSLFVYPERLTLKTCGTTQLLAAMPLLLELAESLDMCACRTKYSRASFLFPEKQPAPYHAFSEEVKYLESHFGHLRGSAYVMGDALHGLQWHIYAAGSHERQTRRSCQAQASLEICMTHLCPTKAAQFCRGADFVSAQQTTLSSGIADLLHGADIDEFVFEPCGYSMNGLQGEAFSTIHITPEEACCYASVELTGCPDMEPAAFIAKVAEIFRPGRMTVCLTSATSDSAHMGMATPEGYLAVGSSMQKLPGGAMAVLHSLQQPNLTSVLQDEPDMTGGAMSEDMRTEDDTMSVGTALGQESEAPHLAARSPGLGATPHVGYASSQSSDSGLKGRPGSPDSPLLWADLQSLSGAKSAEVQDAVCSEALAVCSVVARYGAVPLPDCRPGTVDAFLARLIRQHGLEDPVCVVDLGAVARLFRDWMAAMPRVVPFYAVKANNDEAIIALLATLGAGFDCASDAELDMVLRLGVSPDLIVFANACKRPRDIRAAANKQVALTTFDTPSELAKLARWHPSARALLRIRADDPAARCQLGNKYGADPEDATALLKAAKDLGVAVKGVSFHVGSGATDPEAFREAIQLARGAFDAGAVLGFDMDLLDIGGGFCSGTGFTGGVPSAVNAALAECFPASMGVQIIAEPGRYFAESAATLACMVFGVRDCVGVDGARSRDYWITDGLYGSMNSLLYDHAKVAPRPLRISSAVPDQAAGAEPACPLTGSMFGPSCDGLDTVLQDYPLPRLDSGDWLVFNNHGAYTFCGACAFNGMDPTPATFYTFSET